MSVLGFDDRFVRIWDFYLASCEALFRTHAIRDMQLVLGPPFEEPARRVSTQRTPETRGVGT